MSTPSINPCIFKRCCIDCTKVESKENRPSFCKAIECTDYVPCPGCGMNRTLHQLAGVTQCKHCHQNDVDKARRQAKKNLANINNGGHKIISSGKIGVEAAFNGEGPQTNPPTNVASRTVSITAPGIPPPELADGEKLYYNQRWVDFKGYYRNPAAYFTCHTIILEEINLNYLNQEMIRARGHLAAHIAKERNNSINMLKLLNDQLPQKEADDVSDDETAMSRIYEKYIEVNKKRKLRGVARVFSSTALTMAPQLTFPLDPQELLERCGHKLVDAEEVLKRIALDHEKVISMDAQELLEFFGIHLKEKYAMPYGDVPMDSDDQLPGESDGTTT